jgi:glycosyltransferase involved in cell wall biosynthesis
MRIGVNLLFMLPGVVGGTETYARELLNHLAVIDQDNTYYIFVNRETAEWTLPNQPNFKRVVCPIKATRRAARYTYEQVILPLQLLALHIDLVHSLGYVGPLFTPCPAVVTLPDLNFINLGDAASMTGTRKRTLAFFATHAAQRAKHVITLSEFSKTEIVKYLGLAKEKITAILLGTGTNFNNAQNEDWEIVKTRYNLPARYVMAFGGGYAHKNIPRLIQAFAQSGEYLPQLLVLVGRLAPGLDAQTLAAEAGIQSRVMSLNYLPGNHVKAILEHADLFVLPSLYEGFGLTILEAQACNVAVACSHIASIPEVAGEGAVYFDPKSIGDMAAVIRACLLDDNKRTALRERGIENLKRFSWDKTAKETLAIYQRFGKAQ